MIKYIHHEKDGTAYQNVLINLRESANEYGPECDWRISFTTAAGNRPSTSIRDVPVRKPSPFVVSQSSRQMAGQQVSKLGKGLLLSCPFQFTNHPTIRPCVMWADGVVKYTASDRYMPLVYTVCCQCGLLAVQLMMRRYVKHTQASASASWLYHYLHWRVQRHTLRPCPVSRVQTTRHTNLPCCCFKDHWHARNNSYMVQLFLREKSVPRWNYYTNTEFVRRM
jgi:hypothetical protein